MARMTLGAAEFLLEVNLQPLQAGLQQAERQTSSFGQAISRGLTGALGGITSAVGGVVKGLGAIGLAAQGVESIIGGVKGLGSALGVGLLSEMEQTRASFQAFTKDSVQTEKILAQVREEAAKTPFAFVEMAKATASLLPVAKQSGTAIMDLVKEAEILAASNPLEGLEGASFSLREAMTGDFTSIIERFNLSRQTINKLKEEGVPNLEIVRRAMQEMGFDSDLIAAKAETLEGRWSTFLDTLDTLRMKIGQPIFDALKEGLIGVQGVLEDNMPMIESLADLLAGALKQGIESAKSGFAALATVAVPAFRALSAAWEVILPAIQDALARITPLFEGFGAVIQQVLGGDLRSALTGMQALLQTAGFTIIETLASWAASFLDWVGPLIPPLLRELGALLVAMTTWMLETGLPNLVTKLGEWGRALVEWIGPRIIPLLYELGKLEAELLGWIVGTALPAIVRKLGEWALAFVKWVPGALASLLIELGKLGVEMVAWIGRAAMDVGKKALELGTGLVTSIRDGINSSLAGFWTWLQTNLIDKIPTFVRDILGLQADTGAMAMVGRRIIEEIEIGIRDRWPSLEELMQRLLGRMTVSGAVDDWIAAAMHVTGVGQDWLRGLRWLVAHESTGNPTARNPEAVVVNGRNYGHATGLFQTLPGTFGQYAMEGLRDILNPIHNSIAAINYIRARYGHPDRIPGIYKEPWKGYATGGRIEEPIAGLGLRTGTRYTFGERGPELVIPEPRLSFSYAARDWPTADPLATLEPAATRAAGASIDYRKLGESVADAMRRHPTAVFNGVGTEEVARLWTMQQQRQRVHERLRRGS